jgi:hypothetical protein
LDRHCIDDRTARVWSSSSSVLTCECPAQFGRYEFALSQHEGVVAVQQQCALTRQVPQCFDIRATISQHKMPALPRMPPASTTNTVRNTCWCDRDQVTYAVVRNRCHGECHRRQSLRSSRSQEIHESVSKKLDICKFVCASCGCIVS